MSLGVYVHGTSWLHRLSPGAKLLGLAAAGLAVVLTASPLLLAAVLAGTLLLFPLARLPAAEVWRQVRPTGWLVLFILAAHLLLGTWMLGVITALRFAILVLLATLVSLTTRVADMLETAEAALAPLRRRGLERSPLALFVPLLVRMLRIAGELAEAIEARGFDGDDDERTKVEPKERPPDVYGAPASR
jgi:biotin transport system permease protein